MDDASTAGPTPDRVDLVSALAKLPARQRQALVMHYLGDLSVSEIAEMSQVPAGTVKSWMARARTVLSAQLSETDTIRFGPGSHSVDSESFAATYGRHQATGVGVSITDPLADLFDDWLAESAARLATPDPGDAHRAVARWRRANRR